MNFIISVLKEILFFFNETAIYLLFGFIIAGILHVLFPESIIRRHLGRRSFYSVVKSTIFGIPLPLCSCGAVPVSASLKKNGASDGATISFLIATPQVGADSFMITYSLLGWIFALFRITASLITALAAGIMVNILGRDGSEQSEESPLNGVQDESFYQRLKSIFAYIEYDLLGSIANALLLGLILAGIIAAFIPDGFFERYLGSNFLSMLLMLIIGTPLYVCATASTPIAASLVMKGISPGAALVFLLTGPATNAIAIVTVFKVLGKKTTAVYLSSIVLVSLLLGFLLNLFTAHFGFQNVILLESPRIMPEPLKIGGSIILAVMIGWYYMKFKVLSKMKEKRETEVNKVRLSVFGMTCMHCAGTVKRAVESVAGASNVVVDLDKEIVEFQMEEKGNTEKVKKAIELAGYNAR
jgi:uncharacterized membrane protein YraQ (UPF0718 family)/copper chaperone CopZ